jgi:GT2 family glycosyltransferase
MTAPRVSLVIPVLNAGQSLPHTLRAVGGLTAPPEEVVFVDNGSTDESLSLIRQFQADTSRFRVLLFREPRRGASVARNAGVHQATGEIIAFTDADCAPEGNWLLHLVAPFQDAAVGAVAGRVIPAPPSCTMDLLGALYTLQLPDRPARHRQWTPWGGGFPTANLGIRRSLFLSLGGFDEQVGIYGEDYDLCARIYAQGLEIAYAPDARVAHYHRTTLAGMLRQAFGFGRSHAYMLRRSGMRGLWLELPRLATTWMKCPVPAWVDLASADKKVLTLLLIGVAYPLAAILIPLYAAWLAVQVYRRAHRSGYPVRPSGAFPLAGLLVLKSAAMTAGRWWGSVRYGRLCF